MPFVSPSEREALSGWKMGVWTKNECGQKNLSVLSTTVGVECGVWSVECDSAVSGEPPVSLTCRRKFKIYKEICGVIFPFGHRSLHFMNFYLSKFFINLFTILRCVRALLLLIG